MHLDRADGVGPHHHLELRVAGQLVGDPAQLQRGDDRVRDQHPADAELRERSPRWKTFASVMAQAPASSCCAHNAGAIVVLPCGASSTPWCAHQRASVVDVVPHARRGQRHQRRRQLGQPRACRPGPRQPSGPRRQAAAPVRPAHPLVGERGDGGSIVSRHRGLLRLVAEYATFIAHSDLTVVASRRSCVNDRCFTPIPSPRTQERRCPTRAPRRNRPHRKPSPARSSASARR